MTTPRRTIRWAALMAALISFILLPVAAAQASVPQRTDNATYYLESWQRTNNDGNYYGEINKLGGSGCYYAERRNTSGTWLQSSFTYETVAEYNAGLNNWKSTQAAYDCVAGGDSYVVRVYNGPHDGVTGLRYINPTRGTTYNMCLGANDCHTLPKYPR